METNNLVVKDFEKPGEF